MLDKILLRNSCLPWCCNIRSGRRESLCCDDLFNCCSMKKLRPRDLMSYEVIPKIRSCADFLSAELLDECPIAGIYFLLLIMMVLFI